MIFLAALVLDVVEPAPAPQTRLPVPGDSFAAGIDTGSATDARCDIDADGARDVLVFDAGTHGIRPNLWILSGKNGKVLRSVPGHPGTVFWDAVFAGDIDGDGASDVVVTTEAQNGVRTWFALSAKKGSMLWKRAHEPKLSTLIPRAWVGDVDGDGCRDQVCLEIEHVRFKDAPDVFRIVSGKTGELGASFVVASPKLHAIADAGDLDGDGFAEIAIGFVDNGQPAVGAYSIHLGEWMWTMGGLESELHFGVGVLGGRDLDGDGTQDVVVASPAEGVSIVDSTIFRDPHRIHVLSGKDGAWIDTRSIESDTDSPGFGASMAFVDDVDGDKKPEILIGDGDDELAGCAWWMTSRGKPRGLIGHSDSWHFGRNVRYAGDLDGDGAGDFIVSETPQVAWQTGAVLAVSGKTLKCLWKQTRKDVDAARPPEKSAEKSAEKPAAKEQAPASTGEEKPNVPTDAPATDATSQSGTTDVPNGPDVGKVDAPAEPPH